MNKDKIKTFLKKNGKTIIVLGVGSAAGFCLAKVMRSKDRKMFDMLRKATLSFGSSTEGTSLISDIQWAMEGAEYAEIHKFGGTPVTVGELGEILIENYTDNGKNLENAVKGLIIFRDN